MNDPLLSIDLGTPQAQKPVGPTRKLLTPSPDHPDDYVIELDYSSLSTFMSCPRSAENYLVRSREASRDSAATSFGRLFHECEELRLRYGLTEEVKKRQHELVFSHFLQNPVGPNEYRTGDRMLDVLRVYNERYAADGWPQRMFMAEGEPLVERAFKVPLCTIRVNDVLLYPWQTLLAEQPRDKQAKHVYVSSLHILYTGRIDAVLHDSSLLWVVDHKTSSRGGKEFEEAFHLSLQTRGYVWAAQRLLGLPVAGLIMNAVIVRPLTKTGTGTELNRHSYFYTQDSLDEWEHDIKALVSDFVHCLHRGFFPQTARSFKSPCAGCDYDLNCRLPLHQRAGDLSSDLYRDVTWSPITA